MPFYEPIHDKIEREAKKAERERVKRIYDKCFAGLVISDELKTAHNAFVQMLVSGEDVTS